MLQHTAAGSVECGHNLKLSVLQRGISGAVKGQHELQRGGTLAQLLQAAGRLLSMTTLLSAGSSSSHQPQQLTWC